MLIITQHLRTRNLASFSFPLHLANKNSKEIRGYVNGKNYKIHQLTCKVSKMEPKNKNKNIAM